MKLSNSHKNRHFYYYVAWLFISSFYFYQYILRVSPGIMIVELRQEFKLTAEQFSSLGAIYLYAYSLLQIPLGFILDRLGVRCIISASLVLCLAGTCLFGIATDIWMLQLGRFLIGAGSAPAFICALKLVSDNLPQEKHGLLMGCTLAIGTVGALLAGKFLVALLNNVGWRHSLFLSAALGGLLLMMIFAFIPSTEKKTSAVSFSKEQLWNDFKIIFKRKEIIIYSIIAISVYTPLCVLADLWGTAFLMEKFALKRAEAAQITLCMYGGLTLGSIILPWLSQRWKALKGTIQACSFGLILCLIILIYCENLSIYQLIILLMLIGILCGAEMICFAGAIYNIDSTRSGLALGIINTLNMLGGAIIQHLLGWYLDFQWKGTYDLHGARFYDQADLSAALLLLPLIIFICCLLTIRLPSNKASAKQQTRSEEVFSIRTE